MKIRVLFRKIHHWASPLLALPLILMIGTGILLMLKKDIVWIQPNTMSGSVRDTIPAMDIKALFSAVSQVPEAQITSWSDLDRIDIKTDKGIAKFIARNRWEVQVDMETAAVLQVAYRRSDLIEALHDGSFFADWTKYYLFLPTGIGLFILWLTGLYLFALPHLQRAGKRRNKAMRRHNTRPQP